MTPSAELVTPVVFIQRPCRSKETRPNPLEHINPVLLPSRVRRKFIADVMATLPSGTRLTSTMCKMLHQ